MGYSADAAVPTNCPTVGTSFLDAARAPGALLLYLGCFPSLHLNCRLLWCTGADGTLSATRENRDVLVSRQQVRLVKVCDAASDSLLVSDHFEHKPPIIGNYQF